MPNVPTPPPSINPPSHLPSDAVLQTRNKLLEACALVKALADELSALAPGVVPESIQALANVSDRIVEESFDLVEELSSLVAPATPPSPPAPNN